MKHFVIWSALAMLAAAPDRVLATSAVRALPQHVQGGTAFEVVITVDPPVGTTAAGIEDGPPAGWDAIASISNSGTYDSGTHRVKWGALLCAVDSDTGELQHYTADRRARCSLLCRLGVVRRFR
jgi:hypothetical protein